jgi:uncharacterized protein (TIGR02391 family)
MAWGESPTPRQFVRVKNADRDSARPLIGTPPSPTDPLTLSRKKTMRVNVDTILHPRIQRHCLPLYRDGYYKHAALEAMTQVELALKEKLKSAGSDEKKYGVSLVKRLFGTAQLGIKLRVPLGDDLQSQAEVLFTGAFKYYRNYCAHDGSRVNEVTGLRIMVLASELLDLIGAASLSYEDIGGIEGLVETGGFKSKETLLTLLSFLDGYALPDEAADGFYEDFYQHGFTDSQLEAVIELELVQYRVEDCVLPSVSMDDPWNLETVGWFELTDLGHRSQAEPE